MILLRTVAMTWQQETIAESAREVSDLGRELYKRLATMGAHVGRLGKSLDGAVKAYNETVGSLERQVLPQARRFEQHGITGDRAPGAASRSSARRVRSPPRSSIEPIRVRAARARGDLGRRRRLSVTRAGTSPTTRQRFRQLPGSAGANLLGSDSSERRS